VWHNVVYGIRYELMAHCEAERRSRETYGEAGEPTEMPRKGNDKVNWNALEHDAEVDKTISVRRLMKR
jgi:hypothetical protein